MDTRISGMIDGDKLEKPDYPLNQLLTGLKEGDFKFLLPFGYRRKIARELCVSEVTVWAALAGRTKSPLAVRIRQQAMIEMLEMINLRFGNHK
jgi:hypothetical protein